jgi:thiamine-phosphate pyrophosphorylase
LLLRGVYALVDPAAHADARAFVAALLGGGIRLIQIRAKAGITAEVLAPLAAQVRAAGGLTIVNDDVRLAEVADGVHLGQEDAAGLDLAALRARLGERLIGLSCGTPAEARAADPALIDYLGAGPIFATATKADAGGPIGVSGVRAVVAATSLPVAAIGGIELASIGRARESGAAMAAVISALSRADDPAATARALIAAWGR